MPGRVVAVLSGVLAQWGEHDAILQSYASQLQRLKELWRMGAIRLRIGRCASWWILRWGVVADAFGCSILDVLVGEVLVFGLVDVVVFGHFEV